MEIALFEPTETFRSFIKASVKGSIPIIWTEFHSADIRSKEIIRHQEFDAIVTSKELQNGNYTDVVAFSQSSDTNKETPIFLFSSDTSNETLNKAFNIGVTDIFTKQDLASLTNTFESMITLASSATGAHIVLLEDDKSVSDYYAFHLTKMHFMVHQVTNCDEAEAMLHMYPVELVITDLNLEDGGRGQSIIRVIRRNEQVSASQIPIMVLSSSAISQHQTGLFYLGIDEYIVKPISPMQLALRSINLIKKYRAYKTVVKQAKELERIAHYDPLTRAYNRNGFQNIASFCVANSQRQRNAFIGVLFIDLDKFKPVNDKYGHKIGDRILRRIADLLKETVREQDIVARWGGDEFVILLNQCDREAMFQVVHRIELSVANATSDLLGVTCSIGYGHGQPKNLSELLLILEQADTKMYEEKLSHKDTTQKVIHQKPT